MLQLHFLLHFPVFINILYYQYVLLIPEVSSSVIMAPVALEIAGRLANNVLL